MDTLTASREYLAARKNLQAAMQHGCRHCNRAAERLLEEFKELSLAAKKQMDEGLIPTESFVAVLAAMTSNLLKFAEVIGNQHGVEFLFLGPDDQMINVQTIGLA